MAEIKKTTAAEKIVVKNYYKELPEVPYQKTTVDFKKFVDYAKSTELNIIALAIIANESSFGKKGVNNNYLGIQVDNAKWSYFNSGKVIIGTSVIRDNADTTRRFAVFSEVTFVEDNYNFILYYVKNRNIINSNDYYKNWVSNGIPTTEQLTGFNSIINKINNIINI